MLKIFKSDRCNKCKAHPGHRFCIRIGKEICWHCCNELRIDEKCPEACRYFPKKNPDEIFASSVKVESRSEYQDLLKKLMKRWVFEPQKIFGGKVPIKMSEKADEKKELTDLVEQLKIIAELPVEYLADLLNIQLKKEKSKTVSHEAIGNRFLRTIVEQDWDSLPNFLRKAWTNDDPELVENFIMRIQKDSNMKRMTRFDLISSALSDNKREALVQYEINGKIDMTLHFLDENDQWKLESRVYGKAEIYRDQQKIMNQAALYLQQQADGKCWEYIDKFLKFFPDSADLQYYMGMYHYFHQNAEKARKYLQNAVEIDGNFTEARYTLATIMQTSGEPEKAERFYKIVLEQTPEDYRAMNNLATIMIDSARADQARPLLEKSLKLQPDFEIAQKNLERIQ